MVCGVDISAILQQGEHDRRRREAAFQPGCWVVAYNAALALLAEHILTATKRTALLCESVICHSCTAATIADAVENQHGSFVLWLQQLLGLSSVGGVRAVRGSGAEQRRLSIVVLAIDVCTGLQTQTDEAAGAIFSCPS